MKTFKLSTLALSLSAALLAPSAQAVLERVGPTMQANGYPAWFQDKSGLTLDFGTPSNQSELNGGWLLILPPNVPTGTAPETFPTNFSNEHFYWNATSGNKIAGGMVLVLAVEGAFSTGATVTPGAQIAFSRLRIKIASIPVAGDYKVYTPYGVYDFPNQAVGDKLFSTLDAGITCGGNFQCALDTPIGPFLSPAASPGNVEVPPIPDLTAGLDPYFDAIPVKTAYPNNGRKYLADPARLGPVTGGTCVLTTPAPAVPVPGDCIMGNAASDLPGQAARPVYVVSGPFGTELRDPNIFRVEVNGVEVPNDPKAGGEHAFTVMGRVLTTPIPGDITMERASYTDNVATVGKKLDVYATAFPSLNPRVPAGQVATTSNPDLLFWNTSCGVDAAGALIAPTGTGLVGVPLTQTQMFRDTPTGNLWWAQQTPVAIPAQVCVVDNGRITPLYFNVNVSDEVDVLTAYYDPATATLKVDAMSSDCTTNPVLQSGSVGALALYPNAPAGSCIKTASLVNVMAPPHKVTVTSLRGGVASLDVRTGVGSPSLTGLVDPNTDTVTVNEDCSASPALTCAVPQSIDVLANDTFNGGPVPAGATVTLVTPPVNGVATVVGTNIHYTPKANFNGLDLIGYKVTNAGATSTEGFVHVTVTPVNDLPVAVNDTSSAVRNVAVTLNLLANDADPDGLADLSAAVIQSLPAGGATLRCNGGVAAVVGTVCAGGTVVFTGPGAGTVYTFSYKARDAAGALSANTATVQVTTAQAEALTITRSLFTGKTFRWQMDGTTSAPAGQNVTVKYALPGGTQPLGFRTVANGPCTTITAANNPVLYTLPSSITTGAFTLDTVGAQNGFVNPTNNGQPVVSFWCTGTPVKGGPSYFGTPTTLQFTSPLGGSATSAIGFR